MRESEMKTFVVKFFREHAVKVEAVDRSSAIKVAEDLVFGSLVPCIGQWLEFAEEKEQDK